MKLLKQILIWVVCLLVAAIIELGFWFFTYDPYSYEPSYTSSLFGIIVFVLAIIIAIALCKSVNERAAAAEEAEFEAEAKKIASKVRLHPDENTSNPASDASVVIQPEEEAEIITTATAALEELEAQAAPASPVKVSWKATSTKAPSTPRPKRTRSKLLVPVCVLAALLLLSLGGNGYQYLRDNSRSAQIQALNTQLKDADTEIAVLEEKAQTMEENRDYYRNLAYERGLEADEYQIAADFLYSHIALILDDGTDLYHSYCCPYVQENGGYSYWAYNVEAAKGNGYRACPLCADNFD